MARRKHSGRKPVKKKHTPKEAPHNHRKNESLGDNEKKSGRWIYLLLFLLGSGVYFNAIDNGFVLDDSLFITGNKFTQQGYGGIKDIWTHDAFVGSHGRAFDLEGGRYRPLSITVFACMWEWFGPDQQLKNRPDMYNNKLKAYRHFAHGLNAVLFGLTVVLIFIVLSSLFRSEWIPLLTAVLFAVHPLHTEVVANIKSMDEIMALLFVLLTLYAAMRSGTKWITVSTLAFFMALLSKESSVTLLGILPFCYFFFNDNPLKKNLLKILPLLAILVFYLVLREQFSAGFHSGLKAENPMDSPYLLASASEKYASITRVLGKYIGLCLWPHPLSYDYSYQAIPITGWGNGWVLLSFLSLAALVFLSFYSINKKWLPGIGAIWFLLTISIVSNIVFNIGAPMGERFAYTPSLGICILFAGLIEWLFKLKGKSLKWHPAPGVLMLAIVVIGTWSTTARNKAWKSNYTLYSTDIKTVPNSARANLFMGIEEINRFWAGNSQDQSKIDDAIAYLKKSTGIYGKWHHSWYNLGLAYLAKNDLDNALASFNKALEIEPRHIMSIFKRGECLVRGNKDIRQGIKEMERGVSVGYESQERFISIGTGYGMLGNKLMQEGKKDEAMAAVRNALKYFQKAEKENPGSASLYLNMGITYYQLGDTTRANQLINKAYQINPALKPKK